MQKKHVKMWLGSPPLECDVCRQPITKKFIDGATQAGPWGCLCPECHRTQGRGLGVGRGQQYEKQGSDWVKTGG